jgi:hypothetical protein
MKDFEVPEWLDKVVRDSQYILNLQNWKILVKVVSCAGDDPGNMAVVWHSPNTWSATLYFRCDVEDTFDWWQTVFHELIHLKISPMQQLVQKNIISELPSEAHSLAHKIWKDIHEQTVDSLATAFAEIYRDYIRNK